MNLNHLASFGNARSAAVCPVLVILTEHPQHAKKDGDLELFFKNSDPDRIIKKEILGFGHMDFTIFPLLDLLVGEPTFAGLKAYTVTAQEILHFMNEINDK